MHTINNFNIRKIFLDSLKIVIGYFKNNLYKKTDIMIHKEKVIKNNYKKLNYNDCILVNSLLKRTHSFATFGPSFISSTSYDNLLILGAIAKSY